MKSARWARVAAAAAAAALLPGCAFARRVVPMDASGMEFPAQYVAGATSEQVRLTGDRIAGLPRATAAHFRNCWRALSGAD